MYFTILPLFKFLLPVYKSSYPVYFRVVTFLLVIIGPKVKHFLYTKCLDFNLQYQNINKFYSQEINLRIGNTLTTQCNVIQHMPTIFTIIIKVTINNYNFINRICHFRNALQIIAFSWHCKNLNFGANEWNFKFLCNTDYKLLFLDPANKLVQI